MTRLSRMCRLQPSSLSFHVSHHRSRGMSHDGSHRKTPGDGPPSRQRAPPCIYYRHPPTPYPQPALPPRQIRSRSAENCGPLRLPPSPRCHFLLSHPTCTCPGYKGAREERRISSGGDNRLSSCLVKHICYRAGGLCHFAR